jgi:hypothetical protein
VSIVSAAPTKEQQHNQNDEYQCHSQPLLVSIGEAASMVNAAGRGRLDLSQPVGRADAKPSVLSY